MGGKLQRNSEAAFSIFFVASEDVIDSNTGRLCLMLGSAQPPRPLPESVTSHRRSSPAGPHLPIMASNIRSSGLQHASPIRKAGLGRRADLWHTVPITRVGRHSNKGTIHNFHRFIHISRGREKRSEQVWSDQSSTLSVDNSPAIPAADQQAKERRAKCVGGLTFSTLSPTHRATRRRFLLRCADRAT